MKPEISIILTAIRKEKTPIDNDESFVDKLEL